MVSVRPIIQEDVSEVVQRRAPTVGAIDARLSVWGRAAREAATKRAEALAAAAAQLVEQVGRRAERLPKHSSDAGLALLEAETDGLVRLAATLLPEAVQRSCRLLWVDPEKLRETLVLALQPAIESARIEIRRRQALYRRRARLWQHDPARLEQLRAELESLKVPKGGDAVKDQILQGLLAELVEPVAAPITQGTIDSHP
jgi:hypothetical protein